MFLNRRKKKLIRLDIQLKVAFVALFVACLVLLIHFQLGIAGLWNLSNKISAGTSADVALEMARSLFISKFVLSLVVAVPLAISVGVIYSFKFSGPVYRFKKHFVDLVSGRWDEPMVLRTGDDLMDVCEAINGGLDLLRGRLRASQELLGDLERFFGEAGFTADGQAMERLRQLKDRIQAERAALAERFPAAVAAESKPQGVVELAGVAR